MAGGQAPRAGLGGHVPRLALRGLRERPHDGGRRRQLAAPLDAEPGGRAHPGPDGQGTVQPRVVSRGWADHDAVTLPELLQRRLDTDPDGPYLDVVGTPLTAADVARHGGALASGLRSLGVDPGDRVA